MLFVVLLKYTKPISEIDAALAEHRAYLDKHYASGHLICSGPQIPRTGGVILAKAACKEELKTILANDPFAKKQLAEFEVFEFEAVKYSKEFGACLNP